MLKKSFDSPTVQSSIDVITPVIIKNTNNAKPMSKAYSTRFPPYLSEKNSLILIPNFLKTFLMVILILNLKKNLLN